VLATAGVELTRDLFIRLSLEEGRSAFDLARDQGAGPEEVERLRSARNDRYSALLRDGAPVFDGAEGVLQRLHRQVRMGVVTSSRKEHFDLIHESTGFLAYLDFALTREDYEKTKPHPDPYLSAITRYGLRAEECVVVEDSMRGLIAALGAGLRCIVVPNDLTRGASFAGAHKVLGNLREVEEEIARLISR
jgi:HAD superfamily hydrolase (TIGR01509 family)